MKQLSFVVEVVFEQNDKDLLLIRDPRSGQVVKVCSSPNELAQFLEAEFIKIKNANEDGKQ